MWTDLVGIASLPAKPLGCKNQEYGPAFPSPILFKNLVTVSLYADVVTAKLTLMKINTRALGYKNNGNLLQSMMKIY